ncbi:MAG: Lipoprotein E [Candidatus Marinimicrobia bacterium]|nr:Lipoprotein E [Candidatus Neomarinimicrobiota bacterium]
MNPKFYYKALFLILVFIGITVPFASISGQEKPVNTPDNDYLEMSVLYQQRAAEYRALCYQAYNVAEYRLKEILEKTSAPESLAVVVDIDETVLDNSPYEAELILENIDYPERWTEWIEETKAKPIPGALDFLSYADSAGVQIFYVSNRKVSTYSGTVENLNKWDFPQVKEDHIALRLEESSKESRRDRIDKYYKIALLVGDNLNDFSHVFENRSTHDRNTAVDLLQEEFGHRFIVMPNAMYGEWEGAIYDGDWSLTDAQKDSVRKKALRGF